MDPRLLPFFALVLGCSGDPDKRVNKTKSEALVHRLNNAEYDSVVGDLFETSQNPARRFPTDPRVAGFDNNALALSVSPTFVDLHHLAVGQILDEFFDGWRATPVRLVAEAEWAQVEKVGGEDSDTGHRMLVPGDLLGTTIGSVPQTGHYTFEVIATDGTAELAFYVDGALHSTRSIEAPGTLSFEVELASGLRGFELVLLDDNGGLDVDAVVLDGPYGTVADANWTYGEVVECNPENGAKCARQVIRDFGKRAWRRKLSADEVDSVLAIWQEADGLGLDFNAALRFSLEAILLSPEFLYRVEDPALSPINDLLDGYAMASRLSFFLWSSSPDSELLDAAADGSLLEPEQLEAQTRRMLADPRAHALVDNFIGQWWSLRALDRTEIESEGMTDALRIDMVRELEYHAERMVLGGASLTELFSYQQTWASPRLAEHYGLSVAADAGWSLVDLGAVDRQGLLTNAGWLSLNANEVTRGKSVLENFLCEQVSVPPAGVTEGLDEAIEAGEGSFRERVELERTTKAECSGCHGILDPLGFTLSNYDLVGAYTPLDEYGFLIDPSGALPDGAEVADALELSDRLGVSADASRCMVQKTFTYAVGRPLTSNDAELIDALTEEFVEGGHLFEELVVELVATDTFRTHPRDSE